MPYILVKLAILQTYYLLCHPQIWFKNFEPKTLTWFWNSSGSVRRRNKISVPWCSTKNMSRFGASIESLYCCPKPRNPWKTYETFWRFCSCNVYDPMNSSISECLKFQVDADTELISLDGGFVLSLLTSREKISARGKSVLRCSFDYWNREKRQQIHLKYV